MIPVFRTITTTLFLASIAVTCSAQLKKTPLLRKDSFFGVHFDFHATEADSEIGKTLTAGMIDSFLQQVKPDFVQIDCKGHPGVASYPTKIGTPAGGFVKDALQLWRQETLKKGVALYVHYSGLLDKAALKKHPNWGVTDANGKVSNETISVFSNYDESLMIPQLKEVIKSYNIDGIWVDGDIWAAQTDFNQNGLVQFKKQAGISNISVNKSDPSYKSFLSFNRSALLNYVNNYITKLHSYNNHVQIGSNWLYSSFAPIPININVDFLSGDMPSNQGDFYKVAFDARCFSSQALTYKKAWDLMSWGFDDKGVRAVEVLSQEAAQVISMGGAWQCYYPQQRDASVRKEFIPTLAEVSKFVRARQPYCQNSVPVKQVAVLYSGNNQLNKVTGVFENNANSAVSSALFALLDKQLATEVIMEHQLNTRANNYPIIIVPELGTSKQYENKLLQYVATGGTLLLLGTDNAIQFAEFAGVRLNKPEAGKNNSLSLKIGNADFQFPVQSFILQGGTNEIKGIKATGNMSKSILPVASVKNYGKGKIACFFLDQKSASNNTLYEGYKQLMLSVVKELFKSPMVEVAGSEKVHVTVASLNSKTIINLINTNKQVNGIIQASKPLVVKLHTAGKKQIKLQPGNVIPTYNYNNSTYTIQVPSFKVHQIIVAE